MILMLVTALISLFMPARVGSTLFDHLGYIHFFSFVTIYIVPGAYLDAKNGNIERQKRRMIGLYEGGLIIAGGFTFSLKDICMKYSLDHRTRCCWVSYRKIGIKYITS